MAGLGGILASAYGNFGTAQNYGYMQNAQAADAFGNRFDAVFNRQADLMPAQDWRVETQGGGMFGMPGSYYGGGGLPAMSGGFSQPQAPPASPVAGLTSPPVQDQTLWNPTDGRAFYRQDPTRGLVKTDARDWALDTLRRGGSLDGDSPLGALGTLDAQSPNSNPFSAEFIPYRLTEGQRRAIEEEFAYSQGQSYANPSPATYSMDPIQWEMQRLRAQMTGGPAPAPLTSTLGGRTQNVQLTPQQQLQASQLLGQQLRMEAMMQRYVPQTPTRYLSGTDGNWYSQQPTPLPARS
jgi:hypothetical protein